MATPRSFVIGDIHGCPEEIDRLLDHLAPSPSDTIVFLGDYIDRGPGSKTVVDRLLRLRQEGPQCIFLKGNHEDMFLAFIGLPGGYGDSFLYNGGAATLRSYGLEKYPANEISQRLPTDHLAFFKALVMQHTLGDFLCVHAGLNPQRPMTDQERDDLLWIRGPFIQHPHPFPFTVIFGHTPCREVLIDLPYKIGIDTGLVYANKLSCIELSQRVLLQIRRGERAVVTTSLAARFRAVGR
jgi:serine/threonine protein phosphatase 1